MCAIGGDRTAHSTGAPAVPRAGWRRSRTRISRCVDLFVLWSAPGRKPPTGVRVCEMEGVPCWRPSNFRVRVNSFFCFLFLVNCFHKQTSLHTKHVPISSVAVCCVANRSAVWNAYCVSTVPYPATILPISTHGAARLQPPTAASGGARGLHKSLHGHAHQYPKQ